MTSKRQVAAERQLEVILPSNLRTKKLIGLGEVTHGSGGLHELAKVLIRQLILETNVRTILFEAPHGVVAAINERIRKGEVVHPSDMRDLYFNWRSIEILSLFNMLSEMNRRRDEKISLIGIDIRQPASDLKLISDYAKASPIFGPSFLSQFPVQNADVASFAAYEKQIMAHTQDLTDAVAASVLGDLTHLERELEKSLARSELKVSIKRLRSWVNTYRYLSQAKNYDKGFLSRDEGMAEMALHHLAESEGPAIVWAHLAHLVYQNDEVVSEHSWLKIGDLLGAILKKHLAGDYVLIALMAKQTHVSLATGETAEFAALPESLEAAGPDQEGLVSLDHLADGAGDLLLGATTNEQSAVKQTYIKMKVRCGQQFEYAAIRSSARALVDALALKP